MTELHPPAGDVVVGGPGAAVERARRKQQAWGEMPLDRRLRVLREVRARFARRVPAIAEAIVDDTGKPLPDAHVEALAGVMMLDWAIRHAPKGLRARRLGTFPMVHQRAWVEYSPRGVIGVITPFNFPVGVAMQSLPWLLAAGNTAVLKPSELTPATGVALGNLFDEVEPGLVETVLGGPAEAEAVVLGTDMVVFTGSVATGRKVAVAAAEHLRPTILELGGKDAMIVCDDADVRAAAAVAAGGAFMNAGQACQAVERILVHEAVAEELIDRLVEHADAMRVGSGPDDHVGAITQPAQIAVVGRRIDAAVAAGARVRTGGSSFDQGGRSYFRPTVVVEVPLDCELFDEESFLPVVSVVTFRTDDEAIAIANRSIYGLNGSVFSRDGRRARDLARRVRAGGVIINDALQSGFPAYPFGGEGASGLGRLQGLDAFAAFSCAKTVVSKRISAAPSVTAMAYTRPSRLKPETVARVARLAFGRRGSSEGAPR